MTLGNTHNVALLVSANTLHLESMEMLRKRYPITSTFRAPFYSNSAFQLLEIAYEKATGEKFDDGFRRHIIEPLGLKRTSFFDVPGKQNALAIEPGYSFDMGPTRALVNSENTLHFPTLTTEYYCLAAPVPYTALLQTWPRSGNRYSPPTCSRHLKRGNGSSR